MLRSKKHILTGENDSNNTFSLSQASTRRASETRGLGAERQSGRPQRKSPSRIGYGGEGDGMADRARSP